MRAGSRPRGGLGATRANFGLGLLSKVVSTSHSTSSNCQWAKLGWVASVRCGVRQGARGVNGLGSHQRGQLARALLSDPPRAGGTFLGTINRAKTPTDGRACGGHFGETKRVGQLHGPD